MKSLALLISMCQSRQHRSLLHLLKIPCPKQQRISILHPMLSLKSKKRRENKFGNSFNKAPLFGNSTSRNFPMILRELFRAFKHDTNFISGTSAGGSANPLSVTPNLSPTNLPEPSSSAAELVANKTRSLDLDSITNNFNYTSNWRSTDTFFLFFLCLLAWPVIRATILANRTHQYLHYILGPR